MKNLTITISAFLLSIGFLFSQTTATDFNIADCNGNNHHLFSELDAGKVVVIAFVMPCGSCIAPTLTAYNAVQSYATSHPGRVVLYIADDYGTTSCSTIKSWATTNGMPNAVPFSNTAVIQTQYGAPGMPKIVVLGQTSHTVYTNQNNTVNATTLNNAIIQALGNTSVSELNEQVTNLNVYPTPAASEITLNFNLNDKSALKSIQLFDLTGKMVKEINIENIEQGDNSIKVNTENLSNGTYILELRTANGKSNKVQFIIAK